MTRLIGIKQTPEGVVFAKFFQDFKRPDEALLKSYELENEGWTVKLERVENRDQG